MLLTKDSPETWWHINVRNMWIEKYSRHIKKKKQLVLENEFHKRPTKQKYTDIDISLYLYTCICIPAPGLALPEAFYPALGLPYPGFLSTRVQRKGDWRLEKTPTQPNLQDRWGPQGDRRQSSPPLWIKCLLSLKKKKRKNLDRYIIITWDKGNNSSVRIITHTYGALTVCQTLF